MLDGAMGCLSGRGMSSHPIGQDEHQSLMMVIAKIQDREIIFLPVAIADDLSCRKSAGLEHHVLFNERGASSA